MTPGHPAPIGQRLRRPVAMIATAVALAVAGCSIPVGSPEALPREGREDLLEGTTTTTTTLVDESDTQTFRLFFIGRDDKLETIERPFPANATINAVLKSLEQPPQPEEQPTSEEVGLLRSLVPAGLDATLVDENPTDAARGVRILSVAPEGELRLLLEESPEQARLIVSQVICTFLRVAPEGTLGVEIEDDQGSIQLTDDAAQPISDFAVEEDFGGCKTGTEERLELVEAGTDSTTTEPGTETTTTEPEG